jgi:hypothetical protein
MFVLGNFKCIFKKCYLKKNCQNFETQKKEKEKEIKILFIIARKPSMSGDFLEVIS